MTAIVEVSGNKLVHIVVYDSTVVLAKSSLQRFFSFSYLKHVTSTAWDTVIDVGRNARKMVFDVVKKVSAEIVMEESKKSRVLHLPTPQWRVLQGDDNSWGWLLMPRVSRIFLHYRKETGGLL